MKLTLHCGSDFGTFDVFFGDDLLTGNKGVDLFRSADGGLYEFSIGQCVLEEGENELIIRVKGKNALSAGRVFGISSMTLTLDSLSTDPIERPNEPEEPETNDILIKAAFLLDAAKLANAGKEIFVQNMSDGWKRIDSVSELNDNDDYQLFWGGIHIGDELKLTLTVEAAGVYRVTLISNRGGDYGKFEVTVNGKKVCDSYDLSNKNGGGALSTVLENLVLSAGENEVVFKCIDTNRTEDTCVFGINTFTLSAVEPDTVKAAFWLDDAKTANEGKEIFVQNMSDGWKRIDSVSELNDNDDYQLFWGGIHVGDELKLKLNVKDAGKYYLALFSNRGGDYGKFEIYINNVKVCDSYDLSNRDGGGVLQTVLSDVLLRAGDNQIVIKCIDTNRTEDTYVFGMNSVSLVCVEKA